MNTFLVSGNGGAGKTSVALNLASALRGFGYDVLLVDSDLKSPKLGHFLGVPLPQNTIQDALLGRLSVAQSIYLLPSRLKVLFSGIGDVEVSHPSILLPELEKLAEIVIIDVPENDTDWLRTGLDTILVAQSDFPSVVNLRKIAMQGKVKSVILNRVYGEPKELSEKNVSEFVNAKVIGSIPEEPRLRESLRVGQPLIELYPELAMATAFKRAAANLMNLEYHSPMRSVPLLVRLGLLP